MSGRDRLFRYIRRRRVPAFIASGWIAHPALNGTHHGDWSVLMEWLCDCAPAEPSEDLA